MSISDHIAKQVIFPSAVQAFTVLAVNINDVVAGATYKLPLGLFPSIKDALQFGVDNTPADYQMLVLTQSGKYLLIRDALKAGDLPVFSTQLAAIAATSGGLTALPVAMRMNDVFTAEEAKLLTYSQINTRANEFQALNDSEVVRTFLNNAAKEKKLLPAMQVVVAAYRAQWNQLTGAQAANS